MKKRTLLLSFIVVLLLLAALSTATFAWFSASNVVNVSVISFTASSSDESGGDLAIGWAQEDKDSFEIEFALNDNMKPMIPKTKPTLGQSYESFIAIISDNVSVSNFHSAAQAHSEEKGYYYAGAVRSEYPTKCVSLEGADVFYLINKNADFAQNVSVKYEIDGENKDAICLALFADDVLVGIFGGGDRVYYGDITVGAAISEQSYAEIIQKSGEISFNVAAGATKKMRLLAWYSGVDLNNDGAEKTAILSGLKFVGDYAG